MAVVVWLAIYPAITFVLWLAGPQIANWPLALRTLLVTAVFTIPAVGLCGGPALYLFAYVALRLRISRTLGRGRLVAAVACALLFPMAVVVPALVALALLAAVWVALHAYEIIWWHEARARTRALRLPASVF